MSKRVKVCSRCGKKLKGKFQKIGVNLFGKCCFGKLLTRQVQLLSVTPESEVRICPVCKEVIIPVRGCIMDSCCFCCTFSNSSHMDLHQCPFIVSENGYGSEKGLLHVTSRCISDEEGGVEAVDEAQELCGGEYS